MNDIVESFVDQARLIIHPSRAKNEPLDFTKDQYEQLSTQEEEKIFHSKPFSLNTQ